MVRINKRGIWRIIEAVIAVLILATFFIYFAVENKPDIESRYLLETGRILDEIVKDQNTRKRILMDDSSDRAIEEDILNMIRLKLGSVELDYNLSICLVDDVICLNPENYYPVNHEKEIYSMDRYVGASLDFYNPKVIRAYIWQK